MVLLCQGSDYGSEGKLGAKTTLIQAFSSGCWLFKGEVSSRLSEGLQILNAIAAYLSREKTICGTKLQTHCPFRIISLICCQETGFVESNLPGFRRSGYRGQHWNSPYFRCRFHQFFAFVVGIVLLVGPRSTCLCQGLRWDELGQFVADQSRSKNLNPSRSLKSRCRWKWNSSSRNLRRQINTIAPIQGCCSNLFVFHDSATPDSWWIFGPCARLVPVSYVRS